MNDGQISLSRRDSESSIFRTSSSTASGTNFVGTCWDSPVRLDLLDEGNSVTGNAFVSDGRNFVIVGHRTLEGYDLVFTGISGEFPFSLAWDANHRYLSGCDVELGTMASFEKVGSFDVPLDSNRPSLDNRPLLQDAEVELVQMGIAASSRDGTYVSQIGPPMARPTAFAHINTDFGGSQRSAENFWQHRWNIIACLVLFLIQVVLMARASSKRKVRFFYSGLTGALFGIQAYIAMMPLKSAKIVLPVSIRYICVGVISLFTCCAVLLPIVMTRAAMAGRLPAHLQGGAFCIESEKFFYHSSKDDKEHWLKFGKAEGITRLLCTFTVAGIAVACFVNPHPPSWYCRASTMCIVMMWLYMICQTFATIMLVKCAPFSLTAFFSSLDTISDVLVFNWITLLMRKRLKALIKQVFSGNDSKRRVLVSRCYFFLCSCMYGIAKCSSLLSNADGKNDDLFFGIHLPDPVYLYFLCSVMLLVSLFAITQMFFAAVQVLKDEAKETCGAARAQCLWARDILVLQRAAVVATVASSGIYVAGLTLKRFIDLKKGVGRAVVSALLQVLYIVINAGCIARLSGIFAVKSVDKDDSPKEPRPQKKQLVEQPKEHAWMDKVHELATRGFAISDLLDFYETLGRTAMLSFDPEISTTNDVVRAAIIPLSRDLELSGGGRALASVWNKDKPVMPQKMVTHSWGNLFCHLVCAIIADALKIQGSEGYARIASILMQPGGMQLIRRDLRTIGTFWNTYWVCAFSVNQHAGICGGFGPPPPVGTPERFAWEEKKCDSVTGKEFKVCTCQQEKLFTGINCEMNKFDDMMVHLSITVPEFSQVVAVDEDFGLFERAWCVAELVEADSCGLSQNMLIHSDDSLDNHYHRLKDLDVRECQASRKEDKDEILAKISDVVSFNAQLQHLIFGSEGLFKSFSDGMNQSATAGRIVKRIMKRANVRRASVVARQSLVNGSVPELSKSAIRLKAKASLRSRLKTSHTFARSIFSHASSSWDE